MPQASSVETLDTTLQAAKTMQVVSREMEGNLRMARQQLTGENIEAPSEFRMDAEGLVPQLNAYLMDAAIMTDRAACHSRFIQLAMGGAR